MPASVTGLVDLTSYLGDLADGLERKVLAGGLRAGANVIADEARTECRSEEVRDTIDVVSRSEKGVAVAKVRTAGEGAYIAPWLEHGTDPHLISVDAADRSGRTIKRINRQVREGSLVIGGHFVGPVVHHPGAKPYPFMRPALERKLGDAVTVIRNEIARRSTKQGLAEPAPPQDADA
jgi:HK97 gp10 family phage protein